MMKRKAISFVLAAGMLCGLLAGCGTTEESAETEASSVETSQAADETEVDFNNTEIKIKMCNSTGVVDDAERIEELVNEITSESIGVTVDIEWISIGEYAEQTNLEIPPVFLRFLCLSNKK